MRAPLFVMLSSSLLACGSTTAPAMIDAPPGLDVDAPAPDATIIHVADGTPTRQTCTSNFGTALSKTFGRMDGYLVAIVPPGNGGCNADSNHVHLQIKIDGAIYDVAVDVDSPTVEDVHTGTREVALPGDPWSEGWHVGGTVVDYPTLGVHAADLPLGTKSGLVAEFMSDLASANHISVYATGYGSDGAHLVHRNGSGRDGLIVTQPLSTPAHARFLSFTSQSF